MSATPNAAVYGAGLFQGPPLDFADQLAQMQLSTFSTVLLWSLHVHETGDLFYNDSPAVQDGVVTYDPDPTKGLNPDLPALLSELRGRGRVQRVLFSIGANTQGDWDNIAANFDQAMANFHALAEALSLDGFDFDYEGAYDDGHQALLVRLTVALAGTGAGITYCPYENETWWLGCLAGVYAHLNRQPVLWLNLQCYAGGAGNDPLGWATEIQEFPQPLGITDAPAFVVPGYWAKHNGDESSCPMDVESTLSALAPRGISGAFIWNTSDIFSNEGGDLCDEQDMTPAGYSAAIVDGLSASDTGADA